MKLITKTLAGIASLLLLGQGLNANTISFSDTKTIGTTFSNISLGKFDTGLGTLTGVQVTVDFSTLVGSVSVTNGTASAVFVNHFNSDDTVKATSLGYTTTYGTVHDVVTSPDWNTTNILAGGTQVFTITGGQNVLSSSTQSIGSGYYSAYESVGGTGTVDFQAQNIQSVTTTGAVYSVDSSAAGASTKMTVTYTYTAVPEPTTVGLLLGAGGLGIVAAVRRRRAKA